MPDAALGLLTCFPGRPAAQTLWADEDFSQRPLTRDENATAVIGPATMAPLWVMAYAFVKDFADDILAARTEKARMMAGIEEDPSPVSRQRARAILERSYPLGAAVHATNTLGACRHRLVIHRSYQQGASPWPDFPTSAGRRRHGRPCAD